MKMCYVSGFWVFRDNIDGWQPTIEFGDNGLNKPMTMLFANMLNRVTRMEIYFFEDVNKPICTQLKGAEGRMINFPSRPLGEILSGSPGNPNLKRLSNSCSGSATPSELGMASSDSMR